MAALVGKDFPEEVAFMHVPYVAEKAGVHEVCGMPVKYDASKGKFPIPPCALQWSCRKSRNLLTSSDPLS